MTATRTDDAQLFALAVECDRLHEIWLKSCKAYSAAEGPMFAKRDRGEPISDAERAKVDEAEALEDADRKAYSAIETRLLCAQAHTPQGLATKLRIYRLYAPHTNEILFVDGFIADAERIGGTEIVEGGGDVPAFKTDWRKLLDEYRRLARAENSVAETYPDATVPPLSTITEECLAVEARIVEAPIDGLESIIGKLALTWSTDWANIDSNPGLAMRSVLDFLAEQTGWDPYVLYDHDSEAVRFSKEEIAEAAALYSKHGRGNGHD